MIINAVGFNTNVDGIGSPGELFDVTAWNYGIWEAPNDSTSLNSAAAVAYNHPTSVKQGVSQGLVSSFSYSNEGTNYGAYSGDTHCFVSAQIDLSVFAAAELAMNDLTLHWAANCNNDFIMLEITVPNRLLCYCYQQAS